MFQLVRLRDFAGSPKDAITLLGVVITALAVGVAATSSQSLWIDEAHSAHKAMQSSLPDFFACMQTDLGSDLQMPLYMLMLWGWEKIFGHSEFALRAMNIPLFVAAVTVAFVCLRQPRSQRIFFIILACSSAFLWAYIDEARPYILQFAGAVACMVPLANLATSASGPPQKGDINLFAIGVLVLCGSSLLGVIFAFWYGLAFLLLWSWRQPIIQILSSPNLLGASLVALPILVILAGYYVWTLAIGAGASGAATTNLLTLGFGAYELLGFAGAGPGRNELRQNVELALARFGVPLLAYGLALASLVFACWAQSVGTLKRHGLSMASAVFWLSSVIAATTAVLVAIVGDFRLLGRHLTPALPFILWGLAGAASCLWSWPRYGALGRVLVLAAITAMVASATTYRIGAQHSKDDYRSATRLANAEILRGGTVWWAADRIGAKHYGVEMLIFTEISSSQLGAGSAFMANNRQADYLALLPNPSLVILSKTDVYDRHGCLRQWLTENHFELVGRKSAFSFYKREGDKL
jgi:hypothetical protein